LSRIFVTAQNSTGADVKVKSLSLVNVYNSGTYSYKDGEWTPDDGVGKEDLPFTIAESGVYLSKETSVRTYLVSKEQGLLIIPQEAENASTAGYETGDFALKVEYEFANLKNQTAYVAIENEYPFEPGKQYAINIEFTGVEVKMGTIDVTSWGDYANKYPLEYVLINGVKWAKYNVGAPGTLVANPYDAGMLYQWNRNLGWSADDPRKDSNGNNTWDSSMSGDDTWTTDNDPCPYGYRVPAHSDLEKIQAKGSVYAAYAADGDGSNVYGCWLGIDTIDDLEDARDGIVPAIFLPISGYRDGDGALTEAGSESRYWTRHR